MLLHSCPDTVHRFPLRKTQTSTPLTQGSFAANSPRQGITPAGADCRYRAPLSPRLRGNFMTILSARGVYAPAYSLVKYTLWQMICQGRDRERDRTNPSCAVGKEIPARDSFSRSICKLRGHEAKRCRSGTSRGSEAFWIDGAGPLLPPSPEAPRRRLRNTVAVS